MNASLASKQRIPLFFFAFLLSLISVSGLFAADVLVLECGEKAKIGDPYKKKVLGPTRQGSKRTVFMRYESVKVPKGGDNLTAVVTTNYLHLKAAADAAPGIYRVNPHIWIQEQEYRRVGRRLEWVNMGRRIRTEPFDVLIDYEEPPEIRMSPGAQVTITAPKGVSFTRSKSMSKGILDAESFGADITLQAKKKGKAKISVKYTIGSQERDHRWSVRVVEDLPQFDELLKVGERKRLAFNKIPEELKVDSIEIFAIDKITADTLATINVNEGHIDLVATNAGVGEAAICVKGKKRKKVTWFILPLKVDIAPRSNGTPTPAGGSIGEPGKGDPPPPHEDVDEDEAEDPIDSPPRPVIEIR